MTNHQIVTADQDLRQLILVLDQWFDGFAKFSNIVNRHSETFHSGEQLMIQDLSRASHQIDKYLRGRIQHYREEAIRSVQTRLLAEDQVGAALSCSFDEFYERYLRDGERDVLPRKKDKTFNLCVWGPLESLFIPSHRLSQLDDSIGAELLCAAVNDGVVNVRIGESETPVVMEGRTPKLIDAFSLAEVIDTYVECEILIGGMGMKFEGNNSESMDYNKTLQY